jgi:hypothetical protein
MPANSPIKDMIAKADLSTKIAQIALACPSCEIPVRNAIQEYQDNLNQQNNNNSETCHQDGGRSSVQTMNNIKDGLPNESKKIISHEYK